MQYVAQGGSKYIPSWESGYYEMSHVKDVQLADCSFVLSLREGDLKKSIVRQEGGRKPHGRKDSVGPSPRPSHLQRGTGAQVTGIVPSEGNG